MSEGLESLDGPDDDLDTINMSLVSTSSDFHVSEEVISEVMPPNPTSSAVRKLSSPIHQYFIVNKKAQKMKCKHCR